MAEESASDGELPSLDIDGRGLLTSLKSYGFAPKDSGTWHFSVAPAGEEQRRTGRQRQKRPGKGDFADCGAHPELCLQVTGHAEAFGHTWYHVRCSLGCPWSGSSLQWQAKWRLVHLRKFLHGPVKSSLGPAYGRFFARAPFARKGGLPGTTFRLDCWCKALARCINLRACPPGLVWLTLSFLGVPDPPSAPWAGAADQKERCCEAAQSGVQNCEVQANLELLEEWVPPEETGAEVEHPEAQIPTEGKPYKPKDSAAEVPPTPERKKLCSSEATAESPSPCTGDHLVLPVSEVVEEEIRAAPTESQTADDCKSVAAQPDLSEIRVSSRGPRAPPKKWLRQAPSKYVADDALEVVTSPKAVASQTGLGGLFWSSVAQSSVACAQPVPAISLVEASSPQLPRLVLSAHQHQPCSAYEGEPVWLHIYDVKESVEWVNNLIRPAGAGAFHAAVEVFGMEWSFGYSSEEKTGVYSCYPRSNKQHKYRESVAMGGTPLAPVLVSEILGQLAREWPGQSYDLLLRNCCHFSDALCRRLGVGPAPAWMTALASAGASLVDSVDQMLAGAKAVGGFAAAIDERYKISTAFEGFVPRQLQIDEDLVEATMLDLWSRAVGMVQ
eukprot:TRINITY_DN73271_c0_g1_i1.p1 TRINITY_DN73271_c0_g1~~TRINITY_DN73271_c0_g1_i1.p1  ORF type:complete len:612 (-),score=123.29 TRINITY_DN73271_c0_g1_i1:46-1881(-)